MKTCNYCGYTEDEIGKFPESYGNRCSACKNGRHRYNLNRVEQEELLDYQNNKCGNPSCRKEIKLFQGKGKEGAHIDHYGATLPYSKWVNGEFVRGVLCFDCNKYIGSHDIEYFKGIIEYLENPPAKIINGYITAGLFVDYKEYKKLNGNLDIWGTNADHQEYQKWNK